MTTDNTAPAVPVPGLRDQIAGAARHAADSAYGNTPFIEAITDAVLAVVQPVIDDLTTRARQQAELLEIAEHAGNTAEAARAEAVTVLREVLAQFTQQGHPGAPCLRTPWIRTPTIERWRTALTPPVPADQPEGGVG